GLGLKPDPEIGRELCEARASLSAVGLAALERLAADGPGATDARTTLRLKYEHEVHRFLARLVNKRNARDEERVDAYRTMRLRMIAAERHVLIVMRDRDAFSDDVLREVQHDLDLEQILLEQPPPSGGGFPGAPEVVSDARGES